MMARESTEGLLARQMSQSPTGRQLALDGSLILSVYTDDPGDGLLSPSDGTAVVWNNAGVLTLCVYTRSTGWKYRTLS
jgi:hypothetical protein